LSGFLGRYYDGRTARAQAVEARIGALTLEILASDGAILEAPERGQGATPGRGRESARLLLDQPEALAALQAACPGLARKSEWREFRPVLIWAPVALVALGFAIFFLVPYTAQSLARAIPVETERKLGAELAPQVIAALGGRRGGKPILCTAAPGTRALEKILSALGARYVTLSVVDLPIVNALALPGGQLLLFRGLIDFAQSPEEIAGVLAHEVGHVVHRHSLELFIENAGTAALIGLLVGDVTGGTVMAGMAQLILQASYRREAEREADNFALEQLGAAGIDAAPLARLFDRLGAKTPEPGGIFSIFQTHPLPPERSAAIRAGALPGGPALSAQEWRDLKRICDS
jgi:beta-barrel assembly-enhancing protease